MEYKLQFQYKAAERSRPEDYGQVEDIRMEVGEFFVLPLVGDTVVLTLTEEDSQTMYKVLTRNFSYYVHDSHSSCLINIVVTDVDSKEKSARIKE